MLKQWIIGKLLTISLQVKTTSPGNTEQRFHFILMKEEGGFKSRRDDKPLAKERRITRKFMEFITLDPTIITVSLINTQEVCANFSSDKVSEQQQSTSTLALSTTLVVYITTARSNWNLCNNQTCTNQRLLYIHHLYIFVIKRYNIV